MLSKAPPVITGVQGWYDAHPGGVAQSAWQHRRAEAAEQALTAFEAGLWGTRYPAIGQSWRRAWAEVIPFFAFPDEVRRIIYTTNAIEALISKLRPGRPCSQAFPQRRGCHQAALPDLEPVGEIAEDATTRVEYGQGQFAVILAKRFIRAMAA